MAKVFFVSDLHIGSKSDPVYESFLSFLDQIKKDKPEMLFILGDLFEFLYGDGYYLSKKYSDLFLKLEELSILGTKIYYLYGNHDFNFTLPFNFIETASSIDQIKIGNRNCFIFHGDGLDPKDSKYRFLKFIVRSSFFKIVTNFIPYVVLYKLAHLSSIISRNIGSSKMMNENRFLSYREYAFNKLYKSNIDLVVMGHTHVSELSNVKSEKGRNKYYMNTGFFRDNGTYGVIDSDSVYIGVFDKKVLLS